MRTTTVTTLFAAACLSACLTNIPDPELGGVYACESDEDCPSSQSCLQKTCEALTLPHVKILDYDPPRVLPFGEVHNESMTIVATDLALTARSASSEKVPGEGYLVIFIDEEEVDTVETGDLTGGVSVTVEIPDTPGIHRIRVQARLNDGTDYDNVDARARALIWVDDGRQHVALAEPWPGDTFSLDSEPVNAVAIGLNGIQIGAPPTNLQHVHVFYDKDFPGCIETGCVEIYNGVVPNETDNFGPVVLPASGAGKATLTALVMNPNHTVYRDDLDQPVWSQIEILRSNN